ncbi:MAG TPA: family 1 glycosylhydrolase, partial [Clostridia bacterium]|nr:family 1 glycosylhydrolase [Clostridia bacterium]
MYDVFSLPEIKFPAGFVWGSSTAGHQIEGDNIYSQLWETEKAYDDGFCGTHVKSGKTCNHYELYPADIELLTRLGHQAFRMSIEWSRIEPAEGRFDTEAVKHYIDELALLKKHGIKVFVTLHHFTHPLWFEKLGQFYILENVKYFERYLEYIVPQISEYVDFWNVINEFNLGNEEQRITYKLVYYV